MSNVSTGVMTPGGNCTQAQYDKAKHEQNPANWSTERQAKAKADLAYMKRKGYF